MVRWMSAAPATGIIGLFGVACSTAPVEESASVEESAPTVMLEPAYAVLELSLIHI